MKPSAHPSTSLLALLRATFDAWMEDKALRLSAALAYYSIFSIAPLLVIIISIAGWIVGQHHGIGRDIESQVQEYIGNQASEAVNSMVHSALHPAHGKFAATLGLITLLFGATGVFSELKDGLNTIWQVRPKPGHVIRGLVRDRIVNFAMVLVIGFLLLTSLALNTAMTVLNHGLQSLWAVPPEIWRLTGMMVSLLVVTALFAMIFKILPDARIHWRDVGIGAFLTAILFEIGKQGLSWYLGRESMASAYGAAGSIALLLLWIYYATCIVYFGAEFTHVYATAKGRIIRPSDYAESVHLWLEAQRRPAETAGPAPLQTAPIGVAISPPEQEHELPKPQPIHTAFWASLIKYLEARGILLSIEVSDALGQIIVVIAVSGAAGIAVFAGWLLLATAAVGLLVQATGWPWTWATALTGGIHLLAAGVFLVWVRHRLSTSSWFADTIRELKKDRAWLRARTTKI